MIVYPWNGIRSSVQGLAIARAVQKKYGPAKEVIFPRDTDSITVFQSFFWLVYDNADVRKRLPEEAAQIRVRVADQPKGDGNVGVEEMVRALGLSTDNKGAFPKSPPSSEGEDEGSATADATDGHKALDVRVEWARYGPNEVLQRRRPPPYTTLPERLKPDFAAAWLGFDGFSPDATRGAHTPNLIRAREKWRVLAPKPSVNDPSAAENERASEVSTEVDLEAGADVNVVTGDWIPITTQSPSSTFPKSDVDIHTTDDFAPITTTTTATAVPPASTPSFSPEPAITEIPLAPKKLTRRERILLLARQNAETPLPEVAERPQPVPEAEQSQGESEQEGKERTIRERLWRLVGRNY